MNFPPLAIILILIIAALAVHFFHREYGELAKARITRSPDSTEARVDALKAVAERAQHHLAVVEKRLDAGGGVMESDDVARTLVQAARAEAPAQSFDRDRGPGDDQGRAGAGRSTCPAWAEPRPTCS